MMKKILLGLLGIVVFLIIVGFFLPDKVEITKSIVVNAPAEYAFEEVNHLKNWEKWSYWQTLDTAMSLNYSESPHGAGAFYSWESKDMGNGKMSITESVPASSIKADLTMQGEEDPAKIAYTFEPEADGTKVTSSFSSSYGMNPFYRWMGAVYVNSMLNTAIEHDLNKIKEIAEAKPKFTIKITEETVAPVNYIGINHTMSPKDPMAIGKQMEKMYGELFTTLKKSKTEIAGPPFCIYPKYSEESMDMICSLPVPAGAKVPAKYKVMQTSGGKAVKAVHNGAYTTMMDTYNQLDQYVKVKNLEVSGAPWEVYITDPMMEKDTAKWITEIYYPVKGE